MPNPKPVIFLAFANDREDNARYLRNIPAEHNGIRKALQEAEKNELCEVVERSNASIEQILDVFQDNRYRDRIAVFHFGGHADGYQLLLETSQHLTGVNLGVNQIAHGEGLVSFLSKQKGLQLVFFNGCTTEQQAKELSEAGIPIVIGTVSEVNDEVATNLAVRFYNGIGQEMEIDRAWQEATDEITMKNGTNNLRGLYRKDLKEPLPNKMPWEVYKKEGILLDWKLRKIGNQNYNVQIETGNTKININMDWIAVKTFILGILGNTMVQTVAGEAGKVLLSEGVKDIYNKGKEAIVSKNPQAKESIEKLEQNPNDLEFQKEFEGYLINALKNPEFKQALGSIFGQIPKIASFEEIELKSFKNGLLELVNANDYKTVFSRIKESGLSYERPLFTRLERQFGFQVSLDLIDSLQVFIGTLKK